MEPRSWFRPGSAGVYSPHRSRPGAQQCLVHSLSVKAHRVIFSHREVPSTPEDGFLGDEWGGGLEWIGTTEEGAVRAFGRGR